VHDLTEGREVLLHCLIYEDIAIGEEKNSLFGFGFPQTPNDLKRGIGLARAGSHDEQDALLPLGNRLDGAIDGDALVTYPLLSQIKNCLNQKLAGLDRA
jgi:hypothetical protein